MSNQVKAELAPTGVLRAGINMGNFLLVTDRTSGGDPGGVSPDMARAIAAHLGVSLELVPFKSPGELSDSVGTDVWDICLIGAEPQRAMKIEFTAAYAEIEATYLVPVGSPIEMITEVDRAGVRIAVSRRSAYGLWLERNIEHAALVTFDSGADAFAQFVAEKLDALAGLRPGLDADLLNLPGARVLDGRFATVQQAVGTAKGNVAGIAFLRRFVEEAKASGFVSSLITEHKVEGRLFPAPLE
jgi:polar amino acid transport system substrate-binding protein